jgi:hypothetical protein
MGLTPSACHMHNLSKVASCARGTLITKDGLGDVTVVDPFTETAVIIASFKELAHCFTYEKLSVVGTSKYLNSQDY